LFSLFCKYFSSSPSNRPSARFARGRLRGIREATQEIIRGVNSHYEVVGEAIPASLAKAIDTVETATSGSSYDKKIYRYHTHLWVFGEACWPGYDVCRRAMTPKRTSSWSNYP
jgi:hypothetical protein